MTANSVKSFPGHGKHPALVGDGLIGQLRIGQIARPLLPMLGVMIAVLLLVAFVPQVTLTVVGWLH